MARQPWQSALYRLVEEHYEEFERIYPARFQARYGFWRPVIRGAVLDYLKCGDPREGFARVRCPDCRHEFFVTFSCKQRCICPSCHQKRTLVTSINIAENICARVPHRQFVFTMPKRFRLYFRYNRDLLRKLPRLAWETVLEVCRAVLGRDDVVPGMAAAIQTHGQLSNWHPHIHALTTYGAFAPDGTFIPLPDDLSSTPFLEVWQAKIFRLLLDEGRITPEVVDQMRSWQHSGFSVDKSVSLAAGDTAGLERVAAYMVRCPFSLDLSTCGTHRQTGWSRSARTARSCTAPKRPNASRSPSSATANCSPASAATSKCSIRSSFLPRSPSTRLRPDGLRRGKHSGWLVTAKLASEAGYSNKARGQRAKRADSATPDPAAIETDDEDTPYRKLARMRWAALIKRVWEVDPLLCPKCGGTMAIVSFIEKRDQADVIERILKHCGLWNRPVSRAPPKATGPPVQPVLDLQYVSDEDFLMAL